MHRSRLDIGGADAGGGSVSIRSGSGGTGASGMDAPSPRLCRGPFHGVFGSGIQLDVTGEELIVSMDGLFDGLFEVGIAVGTQWTPTSAPRLVFVAAALDGVRRPVGRRLLLKLRRTATSQGCKYDVLRGGMKLSTT